MSTLISYSAQNTENILLENRSTIDKEYAHFYWQDGYGILSGFRPFGAAKWFDLSVIARCTMLLTDAPSELITTEIQNSMMV